MENSGRVTVRRRKNKTRENKSDGQILRGVMERRKFPLQTPNRAVTY